MGSENASGNLQPNVRDEVRAVGEAIRAFRKARGLSLKELGELAGLSSSFLSLVERGHSSLALTSLYNVAKALDVDLASFFGDKPVVRERHPLPHVTRADEDGQLAIDSRQRIYKMLSPRAPDLVLEPMLTTIQPNSPPEEPYGHEGEEFAFVLSGELIFEIGGEEYRLGAGDSIHFLPTVPHAIRNESDEPTLVLWVLTPRMM